MVYGIADSRKIKGSGSGAIPAVDRIATRYGSSATKVLLQAFDAKELPGFAAKILATRGGLAPQHAASTGNRVLLRKNAIRMAAGGPQARQHIANLATLVENPHLAKNHALVALAALADKQPAAAEARLKSFVKASNAAHHGEPMPASLVELLLGSLKHPDPKVRAVDLHIAFAEHEALGQLAFEHQIAFAQQILTEQYQTFEIINQNWNESIRLAAEASKKQAKQNAIKSQQEAAQQAHLVAEAKEENANRIATWVMNSGFVKALYERKLRRPPTAEHVVLSSPSSEPASPVEGASSSAPVEQVEFVGADNRTHRETRPVLSGVVSVAALNRKPSLNAALEPPAHKGVNIGPDHAFGFSNRAVSVEA